VQSRKLCAGNRGAPAAGAVPPRADSVAFLGGALAAGGGAPESDKRSALKEREVGTSDASEALEMTVAIFHGGLSVSCCF
jgi:hypothetical protein